MSFTGNQHVQIENNPRWPQCQTKAELLAPFRPTSFFDHLRLKVGSTNTNTTYPLLLSDSHCGKASRGDIHTSEIW